MVKEQIDKLISGEIEEIKIDVMPLIDIFKFIADNYKVNLSDILGSGETNGWQCDFWYDLLQIENKLIKLRGSLVYGKYKLYSEILE